MRRPHLLTAILIALMVATCTEVGLRHGLEAALVASVYWSGVVWVSVVWGVAMRRER